MAWEEERVERIINRYVRRDAPLRERTDASMRTPPERLL